MNLIYAVLSGLAIWDKGRPLIWIRPAAWRLALLLLLLGGSNAVWAQAPPAFCTAATDQGTLAFTTTFQSTPTLATGTSHFWRVNAVAGATYSFSTCGTTSEDTYLRVYDGAGNVVASRDDNGPYCTGTAASLDWTVPAGQSGVYFLHLSRYTCSALSTATSMAYKTTCAPVATAQNVTVNLNASGSATVTAATVNNGSTANCGGLSLGLRKVVSGQIGEGGNLTLTAPAGQVFTAVTFASYGTPTLNANGTYTTSGCHATTSQAQVESYLLGQNTATIPATNGVFGDPCGGTVKTLAVQAVYGPALAQLTYTCAETGPNLVSLSATDANGNTSRANAIVTVQDITAPTAVAQNVTIALNASGTASTTAAAVNNGSSDNCSVQTLELFGGSEKVLNGTFDTNANNWTATNVDGNGGYRGTGGSPGGMFILNDNGRAGIDPTLTQTVTGLTVGTTYLLQGSYENFYNSGAVGTPAFAIDLNGTTAATLPNPGVVWTAFNLKFVATGTSLTLAFRGEINTTDIDIAIDNISIRQLAPSFTCANVGANAVTLAVTDPSGNRSLAAATVTVQDNLAPVSNRQLPAAPALATSNVPEASNYGVLYQLDVPNVANFNQLTAVPYTVDNSGATIANPSRVAYFMELNDGTTTKWVWASMDNFAANLTQLGLPNPTANNVNWHQSVTNLNVFASSGAGVTTGTSLGTGRIEMWPWDYGQSNTDNVLGANSSTYDFGDQVTTNQGGHGSFQVHNVTAGQTVFAYNAWGSTGTNGSLGIGNQSTGQPDWTFNYNAASYTVKRIYILVPSSSSFTQPATVTLNAAGSATVATNQVYTGASDNCGIASVVVTPSTFSCAQAGTTQTVSVAVSDANGNTTTQSALVTVQDNAAPTAIAQAVSATVNTTGRVYVAPTAVNNGSTDNCAITNVALSASSFGACAASAALNLDGTNDYVSLPSGLTSTATNFTFEAWVNYVDNGAWTRVLDFGTGTNVYMILTPKASWDAASANHPGFAISTGGNPAEQRVISSVVMPTGWHHLAVTLSKTGTVVTGTIYLDGTAIGTNAAMTLSPADLGTLTQNWLGRSQYGQDPYYKGLLDEVRIWNTARTAGEINLYKDKSLAGNTTGLLAYYDFNDAPNSATVADRTAAARTGTLNGFTQAIAFQAPGQVPALGLGANTVTLTVSDRFGNVTNTTATVTVTVPTPTVATWTGSLSTDWTDCRNWQYNTLPSATTDVVIPVVGTGLYPALASASTGISKNLTLASGATLIVASGANLQVNGDWANNGGTATLTGTVTFVGSAATQALGGTAATAFGTLVVNKASGTVQLGQNLTINSGLTLTAGTLTTTTSYQVNLGSSASISESDVSYVIGTVAINRTLTAGTAEAFSGLGLTLTPAAGSTAPGATLVLRTTGTALTGAGTSRSVLRYFDIRPATSTGLNVTMNFGYFPHELNSIPTANLRLFKSTSALTGPWMLQSGTTASTNTVTKTGITSFSIWTLGNSTNPLPVELATFTATAEGQAAVRLDWTTASEKNSDRFEVERSTNGRTFERIGTVVAAGNATSPSTYALTDAKLPTGTALVYYRLRQVDLDGTATYSPVRTVALAGKVGELTLAPNPARATTLAGAKAGASVEVFDALGRLVLTATADASGTAALTLPTYLPTGVYVVRSGTQAARLVVE